MSYCRIGSTSDVYVFYNSDGYYECCACRLGHDTWHDTADSMIAHLDAHAKAGHKVPLEVFDYLAEESNEEFNLAVP